MMNNSTLQSTSEKNIKSALRQHIKHSFYAEARERNLLIENPKPSKKSSKSPELKKMKPKQSPTKQKKKEISLDALVVEMQPTDKELQFRLREFKDIDVIEKHTKFLQCTKCHVDFKTAITEGGDEVKEHPLLGVLMCADCCEYYGDGDFSLDSDGEDKYCRWCGEGGTIFTCSKCICGFCDQCILYHFGKNVLKEVQKDDDWVCYFCNPKPLWRLRSICSLAIQACKNQPESKSNTEINTAKRKKEKTRRFRNFASSEEKEKTKKEIVILSDQPHKESFSIHTIGSKRKKLRISKENPAFKSSSEENDVDISNVKVNEIESSRKSIRLKKQRINTISSDESNTDEVNIAKKRLRLSSDSSKPSTAKSDFTTKKYQILEKLENVVKLAKYQMGFGLNWSNKKLLKFSKNDHITTEDDLRKECQKIKWFLSVLSTYLVGFCNSVESIERSFVEKNDFSNVELPAADHTSYTSIIQFLGFITNQVKAFSDKGINLQDLLESELYEDAHVLGIKKKIKETVPPVTTCYSVETDDKTDSSCEVKGKEKKNYDENETISEKVKPAEQQCGEVSTSETVADVQEKSSVKAPEPSESQTTLTKNNNIDDVPIPSEENKDDKEAKNNSECVTGPQQSEDLNKKASQVEKEDRKADTRDKEEQKITSKNKDDAGKRPLRKSERTSVISSRIEKPLEVSDKVVVNAKNNKTGKVVISEKNKQIKVAVSDKNDERNKVDASDITDKESKEALSDKNDKDSNGTDKERKMDVCDKIDEDSKVDISVKTDKESQKDFSNTTDEGNKVDVSGNTVKENEVGVFDKTDKESETYSDKSNKEKKTDIPNKSNKESKKDAPQKIEKTNKSPDTKISSEIVKRICRSSPRCHNRNRSIAGVKNSVDDEELQKIVTILEGA